jgi:hypothetical protein
MTDITLETKLEPIEEQPERIFPVDYETNLAKALVLTDEITNDTMFRSSNPYDYLEKISMLLDSIESVDYKPSNHIVQSVRSHILYQIMQADKIPQRQRINYSTFIIRNSLGFGCGIRLPKEEKLESIADQIVEYGTLSDDQIDEIYIAALPHLIKGHRFNFARRIYERLDEPNSLKVLANKAKEVGRVNIAFDIYKNLSDIQGMEETALRSAEIEDHSRAGKQSLILARQNPDLKEREEKLHREYKEIMQKNNLPDQIMDKLRENKKRDYIKLFRQAAKSLYQRGLYKAASVAYAQANNSLGILAIFSHYIHEHEKDNALEIVKIYGPQIRKSPEATQIMTTLVDHLNQDSTNLQFTNEIKEHLGIPYQMELPFYNETTTDSTTGQNDISLRIVRKSPVAEIRKTALRLAEQYN